VTHDQLLAARAGYEARLAALGRPTVAQAWTAHRAVGVCPFRAAGPGCGCSGARCALKRGAIVGPRDCLECVTNYPP
jgi:hypothetical protein